MFRPKKYNFTEALDKLRRYCAYQERCHQEVRQKLWDWGFDREDTDRVVVQLMEDNYLNEERYARAIASGKFRAKGWGKRKIQEALKAKGVSPNLIRSSVKEEIKDAAYEERLMEVLEKKRRLLKDTDPYTVKNKLARFAMSKGYEPELVWKKIAELIAEDTK